MPVPPPVMTMFLPLAESSGREVERVSYVFVCQILVGDGKGAAMVSDLKREISILGNDEESG